MKMEEHELKITIVDLTLIVFGLELLQARIEKAFRDDPNAARLCDELVEKIADQTRSWGETSPAEALYMADVREILDAAETAPQEPEA
ncbi:MAG: hypothetical protein IJG17_06240 [Eubacterium sp.]|nr:hypothetical protein [Eubacterium sp.]